ncbi:trimeric intracellular cation channel family protein [Sandarakinorhabdus oryzae]|uniref:trimeric intracellular cation channel family protein n=1 Tax=Sandarakinorhabdus oryzae TaxID=2675220 RepID=UPI0012E30741|nr:trimeric intracellular cation channel family protein [Sandarakinorhabdus oryzae]
MAITPPIPLEPLLAVLDMAGVAVFAVSGALAAARIKQTIVTFAFFATVTGLGGGTLRDMLIGAPVFWVGRSDYLGICLVAAAAVWILRADRWRLDSLLWFDAVGLGAYTVLGAAKALSLGVPPLPAVGMGVLTASFGGIVRDILAGEPSVLLRREIYVSAAALGAGTYVALTLAGLSMWPAAIAGAAAGFGLRALAIATGLKLPGYRDD